MWRLGLGDWEVERFIRAMHFPPFEGATLLVNGERREVESLEAQRPHLLLNGFSWFQLSIAFERNVLIL